MKISIFTWACLPIIFLSSCSDFPLFYKPVTQQISGYIILPPGTITIKGVVVQRGSFVKIAFTPVAGNLKGTHFTCTSHLRRDDKSDIAKAPLICSNGQRGQITVTFEKHYILSGSALYTINSGLPGYFAFGHETLVPASGC